MFKINDTTYRNLQEQVLENKEQIAQHWEVDRVLADFGIKVLGRLTTAEPYLTDPTSPEYINPGENYGDAYLVGPENQESYPVYIWTRANVNTGHEEPYWLYTGMMTIQGPEGPAGKSITNVSLNNNYQLTFTFSDGSTLMLAQSIKGERGDNGTNGKTPSITATRETNGVRIRTFNGDGALTNSVYVLDGTNGQSIQGPQGIPGKGLNIIGTFSSTAQAPSASTREMGDAFILSDGTTTTLYILTGTPGTPSTYAWAETTFGGGTEVTVNGAVQSTWNADTKLDKSTTPPPSGGEDLNVYAVDHNGEQVMEVASSYARPAEIVRRDATGHIKVPTGNFAMSNYATPKSYVDNIRNTLQNSINSLDNRVSTLENSSGGGSGSWNIITSPTGTPLTFNPTYGAFYEVMLCSEHGVGDNIFTSNVFLFKADQAFVYATSNILPVGALGATTADLLFYWRVETQYTETGFTFTFTPIYGADPSTIHDVKLYYKSV